MQSTDTKLPPIQDLINKICDRYALVPNMRQMALKLDKRALKDMATIVSCRIAKLTPLEHGEVAKWGIAWKDSKYPELH